MSCHSFWLWAKHAFSFLFSEISSYKNILFSLLRSTRSRVYSLIFAFFGMSGGVCGMRWDSFLHGAGIGLWARRAVAMFWWGRSAFLPKQLWQHMRQCGRGNALNGATFISTNGSWLSGKEVECVNALNGATFISTKSLRRYKYGSNRCQCPEWGDLHFYIRKRTY